MPRLAPAPGCMPACPNWGALSCPLFTAIHSQGPSLLSFVCFTLSIVDTHNRFIASLHSLYPEPISRRFIPFASLTGGSLQGAADKFHRLDFCHDAPRFNTTRRPWASLIEPPVPVHRACRRLHLRRHPHIHSALHPRRTPTARSLTTITTAADSDRPTYPRPQGLACVDASAYSPPCDTLSPPTDAHH